jgi:uncharacterized protein (DUF488 family)
MIVSTIGYEGSDLDDFIAVLRHAAIDILIDVRDIPLSRKKGFSKNSLKTALEQAGIAYQHLKVLGDPKPGRDAARAGNIARFRQIFSAHIANAEAQIAMENIIDQAQSKKVCLMCFERSHYCCHRNILVEYMKKMCNLEVRHLGVPKGFQCEAA